MPEVKEKTEMTAEWIEESELDFDFADLKSEAYEALGLSAETDDSTDEEINAVLDVRGLRKLFADGFLFDAEYSREDYADAVKNGMAIWAKEANANVR
jgi:hypothetical protein